MIQQLLLILLIKYSSQASSPVVWSSHPSFITGTFTYIRANDGLFQQQVSIQYKNSLTGIVQRTGIGIIDLDFQKQQNMLMFQSYVFQYNVTGFKAAILYSKKLLLSKVRYNYIALDKSLGLPFSINHVQLNFGNTVINFTATTGVTLNLSHQNAGLTFINSFNAVTQDSCFSIDTLFKIMNKNQYNIEVKTSCQVTLFHLVLTRIIFDKTQIQSFGTSFFLFGYLQSKDGDTSALTLVVDPIFQNNFMMGLKSFHIPQFNKLQFSTTIGTKTSVSTNIKYKSLTFTYWILRYKNCPEGFSYFYPATSLCYDECPDGTYLTKSNLICSKCHYSCLTCSEQAKCTSCQSSYHRSLVGESCPPIEGYFDDQKAEAVPCMPVLNNCLACSDKATCTKCQQGYYADSSNKCKSCSQSINNCNKCTGSTPVCKICQQGYDLISNFCNKCGDGKKLGDEQCDDGNNFDGDGCNRDCTVGNNNECSKQTPFKNPNTQECTTQCPGQFYSDISTFNCLPCFYTCLTCTEKTNCKTCDESNRVLEGGFCIPKTGFYESKQFKAFPCVSSCEICVSQSQCSTCINGYYIKEKFCLPCTETFPKCTSCTITQCKTCEDGYDLISNFCNKCGDGNKLGEEECDDGNTIDGDGCNRDCTAGNNNKCPKQTPFKDPNTQKCVSSCPDRFYPDAVNFKCLSCYFTCLTCTEGSSCKTCDERNRILEGNTCLPRAGFYESKQFKALPCISPCETCTSTTQCQSCVISHYLIDKSCLPCSETFPKCTSCTITQCKTCQDGYDLISNFCNKCGDGKKLSKEECDDGNIIDGDGCNRDCTVGNNNKCPKQTPFKDPNTQQCITDCPDRFYRSVADYKCLSCLYSCLTCTNETTCISCNETNRVLKAGECLPRSGFYESKEFQALPCVFPCETCAADNQCKTCVQGYYLHCVSCLPCLSQFPKCATCTLQKCNSCLPGYFLHPVSLKCHQQCQTKLIFHKNFCPQGSFCKDSVCSPSLEVCPQNTSYKAITCLAPRPQKLSCKLSSNLTPLANRFCGVSANGSRKNYDNECFACEDMSVKYYFLQPCQTAPIVCSHGRQCRDGTCQKNNH